MKQILKTLAAAALVVLAASCAKEQRIAAPAGEETTVEFTVATPELMTKAIADGNTVDKVACNVYSVAADGTETLITNQEISKTIAISGGKATFSVRLVTGVQTCALRSCRVNNEVEIGLRSEEIAEDVRAVVALKRDVRN